MCLARLSSFRSGLRSGAHDGRGRADGSGFLMVMDWFCGCVGADERGSELDYDDDYDDDDDDDDDDAFRLGAHTARCSGPMRSLVVSGNSQRPALIIALGASCDCYF